MGYLTPTAQQNEEQFESLVDYPGLQPHILKTKSRPCRMWMKNGSYLGMNSFQRSRNIRGKFFDCVWGDESQDLIGMDFWRVVRPMLSDRRGKAVVSGQLPSKAHWTYKDFYEPGQAEPGGKLNPLDNGIPRYRSWAIPSWEGPVFWDEAGKLELEIARQQMPEWMFDSEYGCKPTAALNAVFPPDRLDAITIDPSQIPENKSARFIIGHDIGRVVNPGTYVVMRDDGYVVKSHSFPLGSLHEHQARALQAESERFGNAMVCVDSTGGGGGGKTEDDIVKIYHDNIRGCQSVFMPWQVKPEIVACLCVAVEKKTIRIPSTHKKLLEQMGQYEATYVSGFWKFSAPKGLLDDYVMAMAICTWARKSGWSTVRGNYRGGA